MVEHSIAAAAAVDRRRPFVVVGVETERLMNECKGRLLLRVWFFFSNTSR